MQHLPDELVQTIFSQAEDPTDYQPWQKSNQSLRYSYCLILRKWSRIGTLNLHREVEMAVNEPKSTLAAPRFDLLLARCRADPELAAVTTALTMNAKSHENQRSDTVCIIASLCAKATLITFAPVVSTR